MIRWRYKWRRARVRWRWPRSTRTKDGSCLGCGYPEYKTPRPLGWDATWVKRYRCGVCGEKFKLHTGQKQRRR